MRVIALLLMSACSIIGTIGLNKRDEVVAGCHNTRGALIADATGTSVGLVGDAAFGYALWLAEHPPPMRVVIHDCCAQYAGPLLGLTFFSALALTYGVSALVGLSRWEECKHARAAGWRQLWREY